MAEEEKEAMELPAETSSPLFFALGLVFILGSLVTNVIFAYVGFVIAVMGAVGWWKEMLPEEHKEPVPLQPLTDRAPAIEPRPEAVGHLEVGRDGHRVRLPVEYHPYRAGLAGGLAGGIAMAVVGAIHGLVSSGTPWAAFNGFASIVMPIFGASSPPDMVNFHPAIMLSALAVHIILSLLIGIVYSSVLPMLPGHPRIWGGIVAPVVWTAAGWAALGLVTHGEAAGVSWGWFVASQIAFGLAAGEVITRSEKVQTLQSFSLAGRAGLEGAGTSQDGEEGK